jgi:hypothetical protein
LVESLDLNTSSGREAFAALMKVGGAFADVANAAAAAAAKMQATTLSFQQAASKLTGAAAPSQAQSLANAFIAANPWAKKDIQDKGGVQNWAAFMASQASNTALIEDMAKNFPDTLNAISEIISAAANELPSASAATSGGSWAQANTDVGVNPDSLASGNVAAELATTRQLEIELMLAQGDNLAALNAQRADELATLTASQQAIKQQIYALADEAAAKAEQLTLDQMQITVLQLEGKTAAAVALQRKLELQAMTASQAAIQSRIYALQDEAAVTAAAAAERAFMANQNVTLLTLQGDAAGALAAQRAIETATMTDAEKAVQDQIYALQDKATADKLAADAAAQRLAAQDAAARAAEAQASAAEAAQRALQTRIDQAKQTAIAAYDREIKPLQAVVDKFKELGTTLRAFVTQLGGQVISPVQGYAVALNRLLTAAPEDLVAAGNAFLAASAATAHTSLQYKQDVVRVMNLASSAAVVSDEQVSVAQAQLDVLKDQATALGLINENLISFADAIKAYLAAGGSTRTRAARSAETARFGALPAPSQFAVEDQHFRRFMRQVVPAEATDESAKSNSEIVTLLQQLLVDQKAAGVAIAKNTGKAASILQKFDGDGMPATRTL